MSQVKNTCLLFFECIACISIIFIHAGFPGTFGEIMNAFARFGVPLFFVVSGFFMINPNMTSVELRQKLVKRIKRVGFLLLFSFLIYFILGALDSMTGSDRMSFSEYLSHYYDWKNLLLLVICNNPLTHVINWFMIAMIFSYLIIYIFPNAFIKNKYVPIILSSLLLFWYVLKIIMSLSGLMIFDIPAGNEIFYRSWYANGLLFISLGIVLKRLESLLKNIPLKIVIIGLLASFALGTIEAFFITRWLGDGIGYYVGNILCVTLIMALASQKPTLFSSLRFLNQKGNWTMFVYIFHPAIILIVSLILKLLKINEYEISKWLLPVFVVVLSVGLAMLFNLIFELIKNRINSKHKNSSQSV